jgi:hypothetical protein
MTLAVTICATKSYCYALAAQARRVAPQLPANATVILVGDDSEEFGEAVRDWKQLHPNVIVCEVPAAQETENYKEPAQLLIARMRTIAFTNARHLGVDRCWSLDSDVLPPPNALRCMEDMLRFDSSYYGVAACPYPSQGGGAFLGGRGSPFHHIHEDVYEDEREIPDELRQRMEAHREAIKAATAPSQELSDEGNAIREAIKACPPKGNVFALNAVKWRQRGWFDHAYPGIGLGAVVPSDWCGFGCTLLNRRALELAHFEGYEGKGTEDLYIVWRRWYPAGIKIAAIPHCPCDHVVRRRDESGKQQHDSYELCMAFHETEGECVGHLRQRKIAWRG